MIVHQDDARGLARQRLFEQFGLRYVEGYGLTETAAPSHTNPPDHPKRQCLGIPFMSVDSPPKATQIPPVMATSNSPT